MIDLIDRQLIEMLQKGLPLVSRPYALIGQQLNINEDEVLARLYILKQQGLIKRLGVVVKHRRLGYRANAMVVFDVPDHLVEQVAGHVSQFSFVNLCYQRPRRGESWPYNLYCMIHGKSRDKVLQQLQLPFELSSTTVQIGCSIGLAMYPNDGTNDTELIKTADTLMYQVKAAGKNHYLSHKN